VSREGAVRCAFAAAIGGWRGVIDLALPSGVCVADVLAAARQHLVSLGGEAAKAASAEHDALWSDATVGIFGQVCGRSRRIEIDDRVELYLPLQVDPKAARRERARERQNEKGRNPLTASGSSRR